MVAIRLLLALDDGGLLTGLGVGARQHGFGQAASLLHHDYGGEAVGAASSHHESTLLVPDNAAGFHIRPCPVELDYPELPTLAVERENSCGGGRTLARVLVDDEQGVRPDGQRYAALLMEMLHHHEVSGARRVPLEHVMLGQEVPVGVATVVLNLEDGERALVVLRVENAVARKRHLDVARANQIFGLLLAVTGEGDDEVAAHQDHVGVGRGRNVLVVRRTRLGLADHRSPAMAPRGGIGDVEHRLHLVAEILSGGRVHLGGRFLLGHDVQ